MLLLLELLLSLLEVVELLLLELLLESPAV